MRKRFAKYGLGCLFHWCALLNCAFDTLVLCLDYLSKPRPQVNFRFQVTLHALGYTDNQRSKLIGRYRLGKFTIRADDVPDKATLFL